MTNLFFLDLNGDATQAHQSTTVPEDNGSVFKTPFKRTVDNPRQVCEGVCRLTAHGVMTLTGDQGMELLIPWSLRGNLCRPPPGLPSLSSRTTGKYLKFHGIRVWSRSFYWSSRLPLYGFLSRRHGGQITQLKGAESFTRVYSKSCV